MFNLDPNYTIEQQAILSLKTSRKAKKMTQADLANALNVSRDTVARIETGQSRLTLMFAINIAQVLDVALSEILSELETKKKKELKSPDDISSQSTTEGSLGYDLSDQIFYFGQETKEESPNQIPVLSSSSNPFLTLNAVIEYGQEMKNFIHEHRALWWSMSNDDLDALSLASVVETVLNYGNESVVSELFRIMSIEKVAHIFKEGIRGRRVNYFPEVIEYFKNYFRKNVPEYIIE